MPRKSNYDIYYNDVYDYHAVEEYDDLEENDFVVESYGLSLSQNTTIRADTVGSVSTATLSVGMDHSRSNRSKSKGLNNCFLDVAEESNGRAGHSHDPEESMCAKDRISFGVSSLSLSSASVSTDGRKCRHINPPENYRPDRWMFPVESEETLIQLNLAVVGHVDSGKSTLSGRLLHLIGKVSKKQMHKYDKEAKLMGKGSFSYAWALDESTEERERGITMTVAVAYFDSKRYHVVILDSPGHKDFVPNMISGAAQADAAILVIDSSPGSFEVGMDVDRGQTREHAQLIRSFGVEQIMVAVNKMDSVHYSKERFDSIKVRLGSFLRSCGFKDSSLLWVPLSAIQNQNLSMSASDTRLSWYHGPCLLDAIDSFQSPTRDFSKPLIMPICDVVRSNIPGQTAACGKLEAGALRGGSKVMVMPGGHIGVVRSIECKSQPCSVARAGDSVAVTLQGVDMSYVEGGVVLCHPDFPIATVSCLELKIVVLDTKFTILIGSQLELHIHHARRPVRVTAISSLIDPKSGSVVNKAPRRLISHQTAVIEVALDREVCAEVFSICRALGRVILRAMGSTVAVGFITNIISCDS